MYCHAEEWKQKRPDLNYTWERIEQDFMKASELLPLRSELYTNPDNVGRATRGAAQAMLAKTFLYQEKWQQAYETAKTVIESGEYYLEGETGHNGPIYYYTACKRRRSPRAGSRL